VRRVPSAGRSFPFLEHDGPIAFAHRGGAADGLENSMAAFQRAVELGYRYLETDVHATVDGVLLAFHDHTLDRVTDRTGRVARLPWSAVGRARIGGREQIPLLEDVLGSWPDVRVNVDVKERSAVDALARTLARTGAVDRVCVASFSTSRLAAARAAIGPRLCTSLATRGVARLRASAVHPVTHRLAPRGVPCAQVPDRVGPLRVVTPGLVAAAHARSQQVHVWTVDVAAEMHRLLDLGVDGLMTDQLITLRDVFRSRGHWPS
jgi:glycerophosphoryl diester phosphodiesterase